MNTMKIPGFTAEASLYKTSGHYQTSRHAINSSTHMIGRLHLTAIDVPGEVIEIVEEWPPNPWTPPSWWGHEGTGTPGVPSGNGRGGGGGGGTAGGGGGRPVGGGGGPGAVAEKARKARCKECKTNARKCLSQATLAGQTCESNAATMAQSFCHVGREPSGGVTAWGCTVADLLRGICPQAESPWEDKSRWGYSCEPVKGQMVCSGPGVSNCLSSWRLNHPTGTTTAGGSGEVTVNVKGVGGSKGDTFTEQVNWNGRTGYGSVCTTVASNLSHKCTGWQNKCYEANKCTAEDLK